MRLTCASESGSPGRMPHQQGNSQWPFVRNNSFTSFVPSVGPNVGIGVPVGDGVSEGVIERVTVLSRLGEYDGIGEGVNDGLEVDVIINLGGKAEGGTSVGTCPATELVGRDGAVSEFASGDAAEQAATNSSISTLSAIA